MTKRSQAPPEPSAEAATQKGAAAGTGRRGRLGDLAMGMRFAVAGGRQGWLRTVLTAVGVGIGVAVLLIAASIPHMMAQRDGRLDARMAHEEPQAPRGEALLTADGDTDYLGEQVHGDRVRPEGAKAPKPPGVSELPGPGEMVASPALQELLDSPSGAGLDERLDADIVGTIAPAGLHGPDELTFYKGESAAELPAASATRVSGFGDEQEQSELNPALLVLVLVACAVLIMPIAVFVGTAVRFGGEQRDARLAALRLVGADAAMARRMAAGEALTGALLGLLVGCGLYALVRGFATSVRIGGLSFFPGDVEPTPVLAAVVLVGVGLAAVAVAVLSMRRISVEPLGVVRESAGRPRRLWWRMVPPVIGLVVLLPLLGSLDEPAAELNEIQLTAGVVLMLGGLVLLLPWWVERTVLLFGGRGPLSWQLAVRRLQLDGGSATRAVSGITVAVAGAIALQMTFGAISQAEHKEADERGRAVLTVFDIGGQATTTQVRALQQEMDRTQGVRGAAIHSTASGEHPDGEFTSIAVADCPTLQRLAKVGDCRNGSVFLPKGGTMPESVPKPGMRLTFRADEPGAKDAKWTVPSGATRAEAKKTRTGEETPGVLATPGAVADTAFPERNLSAWIEVADPDNSALVERIRTTFYKESAGYGVTQQHVSNISQEFASIQQGIFAGAVVLLTVVGASLVVTQIEQLRNRKRQLSVLVAFGATRGVLGRSVLWQAAVPVVLGLALAILVGTLLGRVLLGVIGHGATDWLVFLPITGAGVGVVGAVTLLSLPVLWRLMRPDGLRTE